ncbi:MAG: integrase core domain-containing protein [Pseudomonadota bacterium]|nr:integrase core domain-containing protein [Pseudomonadota bacterium]
MVDQWVRHYNTIQPHSSLGYRPTGTGGQAPDNPGFTPGNALTYDADSPS